MGLTTWIRAASQRRRAHRELDDEVGFHLAMETEAYRARGLSPEDARRAALAVFGGVVQTKEQVRDVRTFAIEPVWLDAKHAARTLAAHRGFTLAAAGMLALGIGICTAMFPIVDSLILRPAPFRDADGAGDAPRREAIVRSVQAELDVLPGLRQIAWSYGVPPAEG